MIEIVRSNFFPKKKDFININDLKIILQNQIINFDLSKKLKISEVSSLNYLKENSILFLSKTSNIPDLNNKSLIIITEDKNSYDLINKNKILVKSLSRSYNYIINELFLHDDHIEYEDTFKLVNNSFISIYSKIHSSVKIFNGCTIGRGVEIGKNCIIKNNVIIKNSILSENVIISDNTTIGSSGFGFDLKFMGANNIHPQIGIVFIDENTHIGSNCTIDRGKIDNTHIGKRNMIDNMVHIAHNVITGDNVCIAAQTGISGSVKIGSNVIIGGQAGFSGHINIGDNVVVAAKSGVTKNVNDNSQIAGFPATDIKKWKRKIINERRYRYK